MSGLRKRTNANASSKLSIRECIKYAKVTVTERETPAKQWTKTAESFRRASSSIQKKQNKKIQYKCNIYFIQNRRNENNGIDQLIRTNEFDGSWKVHG